MAFDIFSTGVINRAMDDVPPVPQFLLDRFFPSTVLSEDEEIIFDYRSGAPRLAPFVAPMVQGQIIERQGFTTDRFKPAYVKPKSVFDPNKPIKREFGERIGGSMSLNERMRRTLAQDLAEHEALISRRLEVMASELLRTGQLTIVGDNYPSTTVNFGRHSDLTVSLSGTSEWGDTGVDPLADLRSWVQLVRLRGNIAPVDVVMDPLAWGLFIESEGVQDLLESPRPREGTSRTAELPLTSNESFEGRIGGFNVWTYQGEYVDPMDNTLKNIMPDYTVILGDRRVDGVRHFGAIKDVDAGLQARRTFTKSWTEQDPSVRYTLTQSAPLLVTWNKNAVLAATVKQ